MGLVLLAFVATQASKPAPGGESGAAMSDVSASDLTARAEQL